jgi:flagellar FliL protein
VAAPVRPQKAVAKQAPPKEAAPPPAPPKEPKGRRGALLPAIVVAVALLAAAFMLKGGGGDSPPAAAPESSETTVAGAEGAVAVHGDPDHVVALDAITLNLADGRFLKLGLALQLDEGVEVSDGAAFGARALDATIALMGDYTYRELSAPGAREEAKIALSTAVSEAYEGVVLSVYFTEFVMQ